MNEPAPTCRHASTYLGIEFGHEAPILLPVRNKHKNKIKYTFQPKYKGQMEEIISLPEQE